ncbi:MAG: hypothetical protein GF331_23375 [Chitinivibrionales bacterium]|nr:hypothetical protein [Chitinivibrionales bacterium]
MSMRRLFVVAFMACVAVFLSCSSSPTAGGGSDLPNGGTLALVSGTVMLPDSTPAAGAEVSLREITIAPRQDSMVAEYTTLTGADGVYALDSVPPGRYVLLVGSGDGALAAIDQFVEILDTTDTAFGAMQLAPRVDLVGFMQLPPGFFYSRAGVRVPGTDRSTRVDINRMYVLEDVPRGTYDIAFTYDSIVNYMRLELSPRHAADSVVYVRNVVFAVMDVMGDSSHEFHDSRMSRSFSITPHPYEHGQEPPWYASVDLARVTYYEWEGSSLKEWIPEQAAPSTEYDTVFSGMAYRDEHGRVLIETVDGRVLELRGMPLGGAGGAESLFVTVAAVECRDGNRTYYEVVDVFTYTPTDYPPPSPYDSLHTP